MEPQNIMKAKVSAKGWVVIPAVLRRRYGLKPGSLVEFQETGTRIVIVPRTSDPVEECYGKLAGGASLTKTLLEDRAKELKREETKLRTG